MRRPFTGEFEMSLDEKKRLIIPRNIRDELDPAVDGEGLYVILSTDRKLHLYTEKAFEQLSRTKEPNDPGNDDSDLLLYATAALVKIDTVGRVSLTDKQVRRSGLGKEVTLLGNNDHLELWNRDEWEAESELRLAERQARARAARAAKMGTPAKSAEAAGETKSMEARPAGEL